MISAIFFFTQQQDGVVVARYQDVLGSNLQKPKNNNSKTKGVSDSFIFCFLLSSNEPILLNIVS
jgi:hypothetical protein